MFTLMTEVDFFGYCALPVISLAYKSTYKLIIIKNPLTKCCKKRSTAQNEFTFEG